MIMAARTLYQILSKINPMTEEQTVFAEIVQDELKQLLDYKLKEMKSLGLNFLILPCSDGRSIVFSTDPDLSVALKSVANAVHSKRTIYAEEKQHETDTH